MARVIVTCSRGHYLENDVMDRVHGLVDQILDIIKENEKIVPGPAQLVAGKGLTVPVEG